MAYLNVGERRIEATIAYVGPALGGKTTNFEKLASSELEAELGRIEVAPSTAGDWRALRWLPAESGRFRDCGLVVKLLAQSGPFSEQRMDDIVREADGVVVVVDAHPDAQETNRASLRSVRRAVAHRDRAPVPVVLQVNKTDLSDALSPEAIVEGLDAASLPHVAASATRGLGVVETLEAALAEVLAAMQSRGPDSTNGAQHEADAGTPSPPIAPEGGHPLLAALRQVLRETMLEHVSELEERTTAAVRGDLLRIEERIAAVQGRTRAVEELLVETRARVDRGLDLVAEAVSAAKGAGEAATTAGLFAREASDLVERELPRLARLEAAHEATVSSLSSLGTKEDLVAAAARGDDLARETRDVLTRAVEARGKTDREHLTSLTTALRRSIEGVAQEVRARDAHERIEETGERVGELAKRSEQLASLVADVALHSAQLRGRVDAAAEQARAVGPRIEKVEGTVAERAAGIEEGLRALRASSAKQSAATDARIDALDVRLKDLVEELKKTKKGWFA